MYRCSCALPSFRCGKETSNNAEHAIRKRAKIKAQAGSLGIFRNSAFCLKCRIRHLRHTFATRALEECAKEERLVSRHVVALATYMGHADIAHTYWYLKASPELMSGIAVATEALVAKEGI
jgi:integrase